MRAQGDYGSDIRGSQASGIPSEWMTVAEMREYMHAGRTKAYELVMAGGGSGRTGWGGGFS